MTNGKKYVEVASLVLANVNAEYKCHEKAGPDHEVLYLCNITNLTDGKGLGQIMLDHIIQYYKDTFKQIYLSITIDDDLIKKTHEDNPQITLPYKYDKIDIEDKITYYEKFGFIESKKYINYQSFSYDFIFIHVLCKQVD